MTTATKQSIADLNDRCRENLPTGCTVLLTQGISDNIEQAQIIEKVRTYAFTRANDRHGEHDFGAFTHKGQMIYWKFDYYDPYLIYLSEDPTDPSKTRRVLTIMLAREY